ncbi:hypothetical protein JCM3765_000343 [Sporobolomyces pararoseus]
MGYCSAHFSPLFARNKEQYTSKIGRRPPYYPLQASTHIDDPNITIENLELNDVPNLSQFRSPEAGGVRAWNKEHEALTRWFLEPTSPILVDPRFPDQHAPTHLSEVAFAARERLRKDVELRAEALADYLHNDPDFTTKCLVPWRRLSKSEQEDRVLSVFVDFEPPEDFDRDSVGTFGSLRKLAPELELSKLCEGGGEGLVELLKLIALHTLDPDALSAHPIPNDAIFKKFGIPASDATPLAKSDRAFQEDYMLRRNHALLAFAQNILTDLSGTGVGIPFRQISTYRSELTRSNLPSMADKFPQGTPKKIMTAGCNNLSEETCSTCLSSAEDLKIKKLLYCQRCKKVDRIQPYCSSTCQKTDWPEHKRSGHCGSRLSSFARVPVITSIPFTPTSPAHHANRRHTIHRLNSQPSALWVFKSRTHPILKKKPSDLYSGYLGVGIDSWCEDPVIADRMRQGIREIAYDALRNGTQSSIDILAFVVIRSQNQTMQELLATPDKDPEKIPDVPFTEAKEATFRSLFGLEEETKWEAALARGALEIEKPGREVAKEYHLFQNKCYHLTMIDLMSGSKPGTPAAVRDMQKALFMSMFKEHGGFSEDEIVNAFEKVDCEALTKAMEENSLTDESEEGGATDGVEEAGTSEVVKTGGVGEQVEKRSRKNKKKKSKK